MDKKTKFDILRIMVAASGLTREEKNECIDFVTAYEKAEENGMLKHLPCRVGDTVYALTPFCEICEEALDNEYACENCSRGNFITETKFDYEMIPMVGKRIFLTESEAERALKQMGE